MLFVAVEHGAAAYLADSCGSSLRRSAPRVSSTRGLVAAFDTPLGTECDALRAERKGSCARLDALVLA